MNLIIKNYEEELYYPVKCDSEANINNVLDIWMKFSNYLTTEELLFMDGLKNKELNALSQTELDKYYRIKKQLDFSKLLLKYKNKSCTREEHNFVLQFMNTSLKEFVKSKVTKEQQESAERIISNLFEKKELEQYIELQQEQYDALSIYESYVLFIAKEKKYNEIQKETTEKIRNEQLDRAIRLKKNLIRDYGYNI